VPGSRLISPSTLEVLQLQDDTTCGLPQDSQQTRTISSSDWRTGSREDNHLTSPCSQSTKDLLDQNGTDGVHLLVRLEVQQLVRNCLPHAAGFVGFTGVGDDEV
jgi:hypothetical protein